MAANTAKQLDLWQKAVDSLDPQVLQSLNLAKTGMRDIVNAVLKVAEDKREASLRKRWQILRRNKPDIIVRDVIEKIIRWIQRFKEIGDVAVQYDPGHAALPWAAVRFVLLAAVNYTEVERELFEGMELVTRLLARFRDIESIYVVPGTQTELQDAIVSAYATMLEALADIVKFLAESKRLRALKAPFRLTGGEKLSKLLSKEQEVLRFTNLVDAKRLLNMTTQVDRTAELSEMAEKTVQEEKYTAILEWLSKTKYLEHHNDQRTLRSPASGTWLLGHAEYISWQSKSSSSTLLLHGIPGCGKTILCSLVVDENTNASPNAPHKAPAAFFYCSAAEAEQDRRSSIGVLKSLARQLTASISRHPKIHSAALAMYDGNLAIAKQQGFDLLPPTPSECEILILAALEDNPATLVVDAVDELEDPQTLLNSLEVICTKSANVVKVLITGRDSVSSLRMPPSTQRIRISATDNHMDVKQFIAESVDQLAVHRKLSQEMSKRITDELVSGAGETFQWAKLQLCQLRAENQVILEQDMPAELARLAASTLSELYGTIYDLLVGCHGTTRDLIIHAFSWLLYAQALLTVDTFIEIVAAAVEWKNPSPEALVDICRGFLYIDTQSNVVRFVHDSVRTYVRDQPLLNPHDSHRLISMNCFRILKQPPADELTSLQPQRHPYDYGVLYFGHHLLNLGPSQTDDQFHGSVEAFLFSGNETGLYARIWLESAESTFSSIAAAHPQKIAMEVICGGTSSPLFPICAFAMLHVLRRRVWPKDFDWNQRNKHGHTALYVAAFYGHSHIVSFLLDKQADPNIVCGRLGTALQCAAYWGHDEVVQQLLSHGADMSLSGEFPSVLHAACRGSRESVVLALLESGFPITTQDEYDTIFAEIAKAGLAQALAKVQTNAFAKTTSASRKQQLATETIISGEVNGLRFLLRGSTAVDTILPGSLASSALHGHESMTVFLIDQGIHVDEQGDLGTPLRCASAYGHNNICRVLVDRGADVNKDSPFGNALHAAAMRGHLHTVKLLLDLRANINARGGYYGTALQAASYNGHFEVVRALLAANAKVHISGFRDNAMVAAKDGGHQEIVQLFEVAGYRSEPFLQFCSLPGKPSMHFRSLSPDGSRHCESVVSQGPEEQKSNLDPFDLESSPGHRLGSHARSIEANAGGPQRRSWRSQFPSSNSWSKGVNASPANETSSELRQDAASAKYLRSHHDYPDINSQSLTTLGNTLNLETCEALDNLVSRTTTHVALDAQASMSANHTLTSAKQSRWPFVQTRLLADAFTSGPGAIVKYFLRRLSPEETENTALLILLEMAAAYGQHELVQLLVEHGASVDATGIYYGTALQAASRYGHSKIVAALLQAGANPNVLSGRYDTALRAAVISRSLDTVNLLLESGADTELCHETQPKDLEFWHTDGLCSRHEKSGRRREIDGPHGTPLYIAMHGKNIEIIYTLITAGADVNVSNQGARPLLISASAWGNLALVQLLLDAGAHVQASDSSGRMEDSSALHAAIYGHHLAVVEMLLARGFDLNAGFDRDRTPLRFAVTHGDHEVMEVLLKADSYLTEKTLIDAMRCAIDYSDSLVLERLREHSSIEISSHALFDLCISASRKSNLNMFESLLDDLCRRGDLKMESAFATIDTRSFQFKNLMALLRHIPFTTDIFVECCLRGDARIVRQGLAQGCDPCAEDSHGRSALHFAAARGHAPVVKLLIDSGATADWIHRTYGTPLVLALEGSASKAVPSLFCFWRSLDEYSRSHLHTDLRVWAIHSPSDLDFDGCTYFTQTGSRAEYSTTIDYLLPRSVGVYDYAGSCGSALSLAAYLGAIEPFEKLLAGGAILQATEESLTSPLLAAVLGKQAAMVARIASVTVDIPIDPENRALHLACEVCEVPVIRVLMAFGYHCNSKASDGQTALNFSLGNLVKKFEPRDDCNAVWSSDMLPQEIVVHTLLEGKLEAVASTSDLSTAAGIRNHMVRDRIFKRLLTRANCVDFSSEVFVELLKYSGEGGLTPGTAAWQILEEKRVLALTNEMMAAACDTETVATLLSRLPSYTIDSDSLDHVSKHHDFDRQQRDCDWGPFFLSVPNLWKRFPSHRRSSMELLFSRGSQMVPTEENVIRALVVARDPCKSHEASFTRPASHNVVDLMFKRNKNLTVTDKMLAIVRDCEDLRALMAHIEPGQQDVTCAVLGPLVKRVVGPYCDGTCDGEISGAEAEHLLQVFLEYEHTVPLPEGVLRFFMDLHYRSCDVLDSLLRDDTGLKMSTDCVCAAIKGLQCYHPQDHADFVQILQRYRDRWEYTTDVQHVIDAQFGEKREYEDEDEEGTDRHLRDLYNTLRSA